MIPSLVPRVPFVDHRIVELARSMPIELKIRQGRGKWRLRQVLDRCVRRELIDLANAVFGIPIGQRLRGPLRNWAKDPFIQSRLDRASFLHLRHRCKAWNDNLSGQRDGTPRL